MEESKDWKNFIMPFGKWKGKTIFVIYVNDYQYLEWLNSMVIIDIDLSKAVNAAIEHKNTVDPFSN